ncbi:chemotaxis protein CheD [Chryseotalea sanaruensis]|uniref:Chemotaxis protein CheD n=1 Tax=Chryseotalea sanaruensis TaxID=2482724 RepID=A0A401UBU8_9BACT|nr:chemotaxis protein CheD [Chryseotalea sanaruensis]GCC52352.1 chemotaxis protein CheD [Chryseotalea sanaruensis]
MREFKLNIDEQAVSTYENTVYNCLGLGSCIGLFLKDRTTGISGGAHILLPQSIPHVLNSLLLQFKNKGSNLLNLRAKVAGGANVIATGYEVGLQNTNAVLEHLVQQKIFIAAKDLGGSLSRSAQFHAGTGEMTVRFSQTKELKVY